MTYTAGAGMSFWVTKLSPPKWKRLASYWVAVATVLQIHFDGASSWVITSQTLSATIAVFTHNQVNLEKWQAYLITLGLIIVIIPFNISSKALNKYSKLTNLSAYIINGVVIYQAVTILVRSPSKQSAESVFFSVDNETGWNSLAVVFFLSTLPGTSCVTGFNYLVNMTEEMPAPEKNVPRVMIIVSLLSAIASIIMIALLSYCIVNPESLLNPIGDSPLAQILLDAQQSLALTSINMTAITIIYVNAGLVFITTSSRFLWQVTKHGGLAFASTLGKINLKSQIPQNAIFFASAAYALISLLQVATETVVNAILGFSFICAAISYGVPILLLIFRGRHLLPEDRYFNLGPFGLPINIFAACWLVLSSIMYSFPSYLPITADTMNYAGPVFLGFYSLFIPNWYFYAKRHYVAPESQLRQEKGDIERHLTTGKQEISQEPK